MKKNRLFWFRLILISIPVIFIVLVEVFLHLLDLFPQQPLFLETSKDGKNVFQINSDVARRYFDPKRVLVPNLYPETFSTVKSPQTFRIFCLGESTTAGFPFEYQVPFPAQLKLLLSGGHPDRRIEMINLGLSAVSSYTVLDFIPEVLKKQPDAIIIYMGHNEFYGAYGTASTVRLGRNGSFIRFSLKLQKFRTVQMIRSLISALSPKKEQDLENTTLMEQVIADKKIAFRSEKYFRTLGNFRTNLSLILEQCRKAGVPVLIGNLVSNIKDMTPFGSTNAGGSDPSLEKELVALAERADRLMKEKDFRHALPIAVQIIQKDSLSANAWFRLANIHRAIHDTIEAARYFNGARDRDIVCFRAGDDLNRIILETATAKQAVFVDLRKKLESASPEGIIGGELVCDHLHPNPIGYHLMAEGFADEIRRKNLMGKEDPDFLPSSSPVFVTDLDWDIGLLRVYKLLHRWPFADKKVDYSRYRPHGEPQAAKIAYDYVFNHHNWVKAHYAMADVYTGRRVYEKARLEYLAVTAFYPDRPEPILKTAETYEREKDWANAENQYGSALSLAEKRGMIYYRLAMVQWERNRMAAAVNNIQKAIVSTDLTTEQRITAKIKLAGFFMYAKRNDYAVRVLQDILNEAPDFKPAQEMMRRLGEPSP